MIVFVVLLCQNILENFDKLFPPIKLEHPENQWRATYILTAAQQNHFNYSPEFFEHVAILWADTGVKLCFERSKQYQLVNFTTQYVFFPNALLLLTIPVFSFFDRVDQIKEADYIPTDQVK
jgi:hypothetical protein